LAFGGYAFLDENVAYHPKNLPFASQALEEIEMEYKQAIQDRSTYTYTDSDWLQTDADLPAWYDYRQQIEDGLGTSLEHRTELNEIYSNRLPDEIQLPQEYQTWRFNIRLINKDQVLKAIFASSTFASSHYASLAGIMAPGRSPQAEALSNEIINLFNDHHFDAQRAEQVCAVIMEHLS
jgi:hypothetical protein